MIVKSIGQVAPSSALEPGDFFFYELNSAKTFALAIKMGDGRFASFNFSEKAGSQTPWISQSLPNTVLRLANVQMRPDLNSLHFGIPSVGELISSQNAFYLIGYVSNVDRGTANLSTGLQEQLPESKLASFSHWVAGYAVDGHWTTIFEFGKPS